MTRSPTKRRDRVTAMLIVVAILICAVAWIISGETWVLFMMIPAAAAIFVVSYLTTPRRVDKNFLLKEKERFEERRKDFTG